MRVEEYEIRSDLLYDKNNYWIKMTDHNQVLVGLSEYGQATIGDILYLEVIPRGTPIRKGEDTGSIEAGKWVGRLFIPLSGTIRETNNDVIINPRLVNSDPYDKGWLFCMEINNDAEMKSLMNAAEYAEWVKEQIRLENEAGDLQ